MIVNGKQLLALAPIAGMLDHKAKSHGVSYGLTEAGYDIRIKQEVTFSGPGARKVEVYDPGNTITVFQGRFALASATEKFQMPNNLVGYVKDKSTWARRGLSVFNTVIIPAGAGIAQVLFHRIEEPASYSGKYQGQPDGPVSAILA